MWALKPITTPLRWAITEAATERVCSSRTQGKAPSVLQYSLEMIYTWQVRCASLASCNSKKTNIMLNPGQILNEGYLIAVEMQWWETT